LQSEKETPQFPQRMEEINVGDRITILAREGRETAGQRTIIGRLADGRVILFSKDSPIKIKAAETVVGEVVHVKQTYIIVMPEKVMGDTVEAMIENLKNVKASGYYQHAVLASGLLYLISKELEKSE